MMNDEPKCIVWKRLGAEKVIQQIEGLNSAQELEYWHRQTELLKKSKKQALNQQQSLTKSSSGPTAA